MLYLENTHGGEKGDHRPAKLAVIKRAFQILSQYGVFGMIDEWPTVLTRKTTDPIAADIAERFAEIFRPIQDRSKFRDKIMNNLPGVRFLAELKARIDSQHSMYIFLYFNDPDKLHHRGEFLPVRTEFATRRLNAVERVIGAFAGIDEPFRLHHLPINGESATWADLIPIGVGSVFDTREAKTVSGVPQFPKNGKYDTIRVVQSMHRMECTARVRFIEEAVDVLNVGGTLLIVDEWHPPDDKKESPYPVSKRKMRDEVLEPVRENLVFEGALRETILTGFDSGMYGYAYRKRF